MSPSTAAAHIEPPLAHVSLSKDAESRIVFWSSPDESMHSASVVCAVAELAPNTLINMRVAGEGPDYVKRGGKIYYRKLDVVRWMRGEESRRPALVRASRTSA